jgi:hypothetical protein
LVVMTLRQVILDVTYDSPITIQEGIVSEADPAKYREAAESCRKKARRAGNPSEWVRYAEEWEKLARVADALAATALPVGHRPIASGTSRPPS